MREKLLKMRDELQQLASTADEAASVVELDQTKVGRLSRMDALQSQAMAQASVQRREVMLRRIDAALKRIDDDEYGYCRDCGEAIDPRRLEIDPTALLCIACASRSDA